MKAKKKVRKINKISILVVLVLILVITTLIIYAKNIQPTSEATASTISVTYKVGDGTYTDSDGNDLGDSVTYDEVIYDSQTQGDNDYTDNKIVLKSNSDIGFTHESTTYNGLEYEMVLTGWKLTSVTQNGTTITTFVEPENQNYADPSDAAKDIDTVYAQNGWYIVPDNVTSITVEAVYGRAIYIRSPYDTMYYDEYHIFYYGENSDGTTSLAGTGTAYSSDSNYGTSEDDAVATLKRAYELIDEDSTATVYDTVIVLCGDLYEVNYNTNGSSYVPSSYSENYEAYSSKYWGYTNSTTKPATITSLSSITGDDVDRHNLYNIGPAANVYFYSSLRWDDLNISKLSTNNLVDIHENSVSITTYTIARNITISTSGVTFESTENSTASDVASLWFQGASKVTINGAAWTVFTMYRATTITYDAGRYVYIGGLADVSKVSAGANNDSSSSDEEKITNPPTIVVTGGKISAAYGTSIVETGSIKGNVNIYVSGGSISNIYGGGNGSVYASDSETGTGNVNIEIYGGTIGNIYGGGQYYTSIIYGNVNISMENAIIEGNVYGGGKGGKIKGSVKLNIDNCKVSGTVYGAGFGLTDTVSSYYLDSQTSDSSAWETAVANFNTSAASLGLVSWSEAPTGFPMYDEDENLILTRRYHSTYVRKRKLSFI